MAWAGAYPWHEGHHAHNFRAPGPGVVVPASYFEAELRKDVPTHPHTAAHGMPPQAKLEDSSAAAGGTKNYGRFAAPYGTVDKTAPSNLKYYPLEGKHTAADALVQHHGYQTYYAGGAHGRPDLASRNYTTGHLMVYDPASDSGWENGYTDAWRKTHELAHALTLNDLNAKYGEGRRLGSLGKQRTAREAKRAVEWEWLAAHKQRDLAGHLGAHITDDDFHRELNTVMHDAVHRAVTGKFTDPQREGFRPHAHKVPLDTALGMVDEAAGQLGLAGEHDLLRKSGRDSTNLFFNRSLEPHMSDEAVSRNDVRDALVANLKKHEAAIKAHEAREAAGGKKLRKASTDKGHPSDQDFVGSNVTGSYRPMNPNSGAVHCYVGGDGKEACSGQVSRAGTGGKAACDTHRGDMKKNAVLGYGAPSASEDMAMAEKPAAPTPVSQVNKELKGFKSVAANPTAMPGGKLGKDEIPAEKPDQTCPNCQAAAMKWIGSHLGADHYLCKCGTSASCGQTKSAEAPGGDDPMAKKTLDANADVVEQKAAQLVEGEKTGAVLPNDKKSKTIEAPGSGDSDGKVVTKGEIEDGKPCKLCGGKPHKGHKGLLMHGASPEALQADTDESDREYIAQRQARKAKGLKKNNPSAPAGVEGWADDPDLACGHCGGDLGIGYKDGQSRTLYQDGNEYVRCSHCNKVSHVESDNDPYGDSAQSTQTLAAPPVSVTQDPYMPGKTGPAVQKSLKKADTVMSRVMNRLQLGQGGTPVGKRAPLPGVTAALPRGVAPGTSPEVATSLGALHTLRRPPVPSAARAGVSVMMKVGHIKPAVAKPAAAKPAAVPPPIPADAKKPPMGKMEKAAMPGTSAPKAPSAGTPPKTASNPMAASAGAKAPSAKPAATPKL